MLRNADVDTRPLHLSCWAAPGRLKWLAGRLEPATHFVADARRVFMSWTNGLFILCKHVYCLLLGPEPRHEWARCLDGHTNTENLSIGAELRPARPGPACWASSKSPSQSFQLPAILLFRLGCVCQRGLHVDVGQRIWLPMTRH